MDFNGLNGNQFGRDNVQNNSFNFPQPRSAEADKWLEEKKEVRNERRKRAGLGFTLGVVISPAFSVPELEPYAWTGWVIASLIFLGYGLAYLVAKFSYDLAMRSVNGRR